MGYEPEINHKKLCPFKFHLNPSYCEKEKCALWLIVQKSCSLQVIAHGIGLHKKNFTDYEDKYYDV